MVRFLLFLFLSFPFALAAELSAPIVLIYETGGKKSDNAFIDMARQGAERARNELGLDYLEHRIRAGESREAVFERYAKDGAELVIALGFQNASAVTKVAGRYPVTSFTLIDGVVPPLLSNVQSVVFRDNEGAYLVGALAAMTSKSGKIGFIGGMDVPVIRDFAYGYTQGAEYVNNEIEIVRDMIGTTEQAWSNPKRAGQLAQKQIAQGADVLFAAAGGSGVGMLQKAAAYEDIYGIGVDFNQNALFPGSVLTSLVKRVDKAVFNAMRQHSDHSWKPGTLYLGIKEGALDYAVDSHNRSLLTPEHIEALEKIKDYIISGLIRVDNYRQE